MADGGFRRERIAESFRLNGAHTLVTRSLKNAQVVISECAGLPPRLGLSDAIPEDDAFIVGLQLQDYDDCEHWENGRCVGKTQIRAGQTTLYDVTKDPRFVIDRPLHVMFFYIPRVAFDSLAEDIGAPKLDTLDYRFGVGFDDPIVRNLGQSMRAALAQPNQASQLFVDHVTDAVVAHVAQTYGGLAAVKAPVKGGLAGWQERRACELMEANLQGGIALKDIASECGLSVSHFARAFRVAVGASPHQWLLQRRVEVAKHLMRNSQRSLSEIAIEAGFADQSHLTRVFSRIVGASPGAWRRCIVTSVRRDDD